MVPAVVKSVSELVNVGHISVIKLKVFMNISRVKEYQFVRKENVTFMIM